MRNSCSYSEANKPRLGKQLLIEVSHICFTDTYIYYIYTITLYSALHNAVIVYLLLVYVVNKLCETCRCDKGCTSRRGQARVKCSCRCDVTHATCHMPHATSSGHAHLLMLLLNTRVCHDSLQKCVQTTIAKWPYMLPLSLAPSPSPSLLLFSPSLLLCI